MGTGERSYLDHNATVPVRPEVARAMLDALALVGNASSVHAEGRRARAAIETARAEVAMLVGRAARDVIFTSGGTEAVNAALSPSLRRVGEAVGASTLLVGATEHACALDGHRFPAAAVERIPVDPNGVIDLAWLEARISRSPDHRILVSVQAANNETGVVQPVERVCAVAQAAGALVHCDAVQAAGRIPLAWGSRRPDVLALSAHKLGGPKGVGALIFDPDAVEVREPLLRGGGQERGARAGTENVPGVVGFGMAAKAAGAGLDAEARRLRTLRGLVEGEIRRIAPDAVIFGEGAERLPNTTCFALPGVRAETALIALDLAGVAVSSGAACSSGKVRRSHVLDAMGVPAALAEGALRVSLGWTSTENDVDRFASAFEKLVRALYKRKADAA